MEQVKNYKHTNLNECMCIPWHVRTHSWLNLAEFHWCNRVRSAQHNWFHSATAYIECSAIGYIHESCKFRAVQLGIFFTALMSTFHRFYCTKSMEHLISTITHQIPAFQKSTHWELTVQEVACPQSTAEHIEVRCRCKGNCIADDCNCFKAKDK